MLIPIRQTEFHPDGHRDDSEDVDAFWVFSGLRISPDSYREDRIAWLRISMDRISDSDSEDAGSIPAGATN